MNPAIQGRVGSRKIGCSADFRKKRSKRSNARFSILSKLLKMERETGLEPATSSLGK